MKRLKYGFEYTNTLKYKELEGIGQLVSDIALTLLLRMISGETAF